MSSESPEYMSKIPQTNLAHNTEKNKTLQISQQMQNSGQERLEIQKEKNYTDFLGNF